MEKKFKAFTLVEMLIVMGILAILMTIGISVGRFAIQRANNIQHQSAVDQIGQAIQSSYTDQRRYPDADELTGNFSTGVLDEYIDASFDGGSEATFYYDTTATNQAYLVCVSFGGQGDTDELGFYCTGDGFEDDEIFGGLIGEKQYDFDAAGPYADAMAELSAAAGGASGVQAQWDGSDWEN